jgi:hypothetical protein
MRNSNTTAGLILIASAAILGCSSATLHNQTAHTQRKIASDSDALFPPEISTVRAPITDSLSSRPGSPLSRTLPNDNIEMVLDSDLPSSGSTPQIIGFTIYNTGSPKTNPKGTGSSTNGPFRKYTFEFPQMARQDIDLYIHESSDPQGDDSKVSMETVISFFPRRNLPAIRESAQSDALEVILPTGESVLVDRKTKEFIGGVLTETGPIDLSTDRIKRRFAQLSYSGKGVMVRVDQRAEDPRGAVVWGVKKQARITYLNKQCIVSPAELWEQKSDTFASLFPTDEAFFEFLKRRCRWDFDAQALDTNPT